MLDPQTEKAIVKLTELVRLVFGTDLVSLTLYGSAAGEDFVPGKSDLNLAIVLERITFPYLKALHAHLPKWHSLGATVPLLLDRRFVEQGRDVFPMEFHDIKEQHRVLYGEEIFARLEIDSRHLRYQAEHEARGKLLRLRSLYAEVGADRKRLENLMLSSAKTFVIVMRNFVRLHRGESHTRYLAVLDEFEKHFHQRFPVMRDILNVKLGLQPWPDHIEETFGVYLEEVEALVEVFDRALPESEDGN